ncbi:Nuclear transcription factor Y subunit B-6 [Dorcoceras hygrometricum]|nr:Nuclear transcription factor Y subunit B-6 [Dorcoceras hygrometricum]
MTFWAIPEMMMITQEANSEATHIAIDTSHMTCNHQFKRNPDEYLPIPNVIKIMRQVLPPHVKISDDSKETIQECVSEFVAFFTRTANEICHRECRRIIKPEDVLSALQSKGFDDYIEPLTVFLKKYRTRGGSNHVPQAVPEAMDQPVLQPQVIQSTASFGSTSTLYQADADELSKILDYLIGDRSARGEGSCGSSLFEPCNN